MVVNQPSLVRVGGARPPPFTLSTIMSKVVVYAPADKADKLLLFLLCVLPFHCFMIHCNKKESKIFLIYKEIQSGAVAKSYMRKGFLIYEEMRKYFPIYGEAVSYIWLCNCSILNFPIYMRKIWFSFLSVYMLWLHVHCTFYSVVHTTVCSLLLSR